MISMYSAFFHLVVSLRRFGNFWVVDSNNLQREPLEETEGLNIFTADSTGCHKTSKTEEKKHSNTNVKLSGGSVV